MGWVGGFTALLFLAALPVRAADAPVPWECSNYDGDAQIRCLNTFIELQRDKIGQLEGELRAQKGVVGQLKEQIDRQAAATTNLERQLSPRAPSTFVPAPYAYSYPFPFVYSPGFGLGLYFGRPWIYGPSYSISPHWGFRLHRHWGHRR
jgi:hypothetical protein